MLVEELKALERRFYDEINKMNLTACFELVANDFLEHTPMGDTRGREDEIKAFIDLLKAFPDAHFTIDDILAEGDKVVARWTMTGTHQPTNNKVTVWGIEICRVVGGKFVEVWARMDTLGYMQQLGFVPRRGRPDIRELRSP